MGRGADRLEGALSLRSREEVNDPVWDESVTRAFLNGTRRTRVTIDDGARMQDPFTFRFAFLKSLSFDACKHRTVPELAREIIFNEEI